MMENSKDKKKPPFKKILKKSCLTFWAMAPLLLGTIGLVGLFQILVSPAMLAALFQNNPWVDTLIGTLSGAAAAGNPVVSYLLGGELLQQGVSLYAVTAFILSWVTLGFIQLPAEASILGTRFTFYRNILAFFFTMIIAVLTTLTLRLFS